MFVIEVYKPVFGNLLCQPPPRAFSGKHRNQLVMRIKHAIIEVSTCFEERTDMTKGIIQNLHYLTGKCYVYEETIRKKESQNKTRTSA